VRGDIAGLAGPSRASPNEDEREGGGTDGYVSSSARGTVPFSPIESDDAGVVMFVVILVEGSSGENGNCEDKDADEDEGAVVDVLSAIAVWDGRWICEGGLGISTRADGITEYPFRLP
jgi:hypothetical protein